MKQYTIMEFMAQLGILYDDPCTAWKDFRKWNQAMPPELRPRAIKWGGRKLIEVES